MSWNGVKKQANKVEIENWCEEMGIENYTINSQGEIDVDSGVKLVDKNIKELPYKFGVVKGHFNLGGCKNLISLKNCPYFVGDSFSCVDCSKLESLEGCPKEVSGWFFCYDCKRKFTSEEIKSSCEVKGYTQTKYKIKRD